MTISKTDFGGSKLKIQRARRHISELEHCIQAWINNDPDILVIDTDLDTGTQAIRPNYGSLFYPADIPLALGDTVHNLRASFDYVTTFYMGGNDDRVTFPIGRERKDVISHASFRGIHKAVPKLADFILDDIQPYEGGNYRAWEISKLDNTDKHKFIVPITIITGVVGYSGVDQSGLTIESDKITFGLGSEKIQIVGGLSGFKVTSKGKPTLSIQFPQGLPFENDPVVPTLVQLADFSLKAIETLELFCFGKVSDPDSIVI